MIYYIFSDFTWPHPSIHPPPNHKEVSPQISNLQTGSKYLDLFKTYWIFTDMGCAPFGVGGCLGEGVSGSPPHTCAHRCICIHKHVNHDKHVGGHLQFLCMYILACTWVHVCVCVCMHACMWGTPCTPPLGYRGPKSLKYNKTWMNWDNSILFEDLGLCTFLHSYRLGLMCRGGVVSQIAFFTLGPKKYVFWVLWAPR